MTNQPQPTSALWPTAHQAIMAGQSPAVPGPPPAAEKGHTERARVAQVGERPVDRKSPGMAPVVDGEVAGSSPAPGHTFPAEKDYRRLTTRCPVHGIWDCSQLLNGCSLPIYLNRAFDAGRVSAVREARAEIGQMLDTFPQQGRHTRARWAVAWLDHIIGRLTLPPESPNAVDVWNDQDGDQA